jgi:hypothetical protein
MTESRLYAAQLEKKLIKEFKEKFQEKIGYTPIILTKIDTGDFYIPLMTMDQLIKYFDPFLPSEFGKKLTLPSKSRKREVVELRMMFCFLARSMKYKLSTIGERLGARDHTTVIHNVSTFLNLIETDEQFRTKFQSILNHIKQNHESPNLDEFDTSQCLPEPALFS